MITKTDMLELALDAYIAERDTPYMRLFSAARYALLRGGKRLRPILSMATAEAFGVKAESALSTACALEMIHTYSLIHDDLPCMDNDDFRRGKPSLHKAFDEATALLAGDFLLTHAFSIIALDPELTPFQRISLIQLLASHAGGDGMIGGQMMDIEAEGVSINIELLKQIHALKTGALITASILSGGIVANASKDEMESLHLFGKDIGLAFQIIDDVVDVISSEAKHGKKTASDEANNKSTYVSLMGVDKAKKAAEDLYQRSLTHLDAINRDTTLLKELAKQLVYRNS
ncbi:MAG: polyprenyl synthetase family protein [Parachlamydiaceae bacterium]